MRKSTRDVDTALLDFSIAPELLDRKLEIVFLFPFLGLCLRLTDECLLIFNFLILVSWMERQAWLISLILIPMDRRLAGYRILLS
jgi:hypothetical protein